MSWSDDRLDDFSGSIQEMRVEMRAGFKDVHAEIKADRAELRAELQAIRSTMELRFDAVQRSMLWMMGTILVVLASILGATQL